MLSSGDARKPAPALTAAPNKALPMVGAREQWRFKMREMLKAVLRSQPFNPPLSDATVDIIVDRILAQRPTEAELAAMLQVNGATDPPRAAHSVMTIMAAAATQQPAAQPQLPPPTTTVPGPLPPLVGVGAPVQAAPAPAQQPAAPATPAPTQNADGSWSVPMPAAQINMPAPMVYNLTPANAPAPVVANAAAPAVVPPVVVPTNGRNNWLWLGLAAILVLGILGYLGLKGYFGHLGHKIDAVAAKMPDPKLVAEGAYDSKRLTEAILGKPNKPCDKNATSWYERVDNGAAAATQTRDALLKPDGNGQTVVDKVSATHLIVGVALTDKHGQPVKIGEQMKKNSAAIAAMKKTVDDLAKQSKEDPLKVIGHPSSAVISAMKKTLDDLAARSNGKTVRIVDNPYLKK